jgi:tight adherence protein C
MPDLTLIIPALLAFCACTSAAAAILPTSARGQPLWPKTDVKGRIFAIPSLAALERDSDLVLRFRQAGLRDRDHVRLYLVLRFALPVMAVAAGLAFVLILPGKNRSVVWLATFLLFLAAIGYVLPSIYIRQRAAQRKEAIRREWPDVLDLMLLSVEAGMGLDAVLDVVSKRIVSSAPVVAEELEITLAELNYLSDRKLALSNLAARVDLPAVSLVVTALIQAERYGTSIGTTLRNTTRDQRVSRLADAERKAAALPPQLTIPMVLFFLPVLFAVIFTPGIILYLLDT